MREALADLQAQLESGVPPEVAIAETAKTHGFRSDVVAKRAEPLGPLHEIGPKAASRLERQRKEAAERAAERNAIRDFCFKSSGESFEQWMIEKTGRSPSDEENAQAFDIISRHLVTEMLKSEKIKRA